MDKMDRFMREAEVALLTGLSRSTRWRLERTGKFPQRRRISTNAVAWRESEIQNWMDQIVGETADTAPHQPKATAA